MKVENESKSVKLTVGMELALTAQLTAFMTDSRMSLSEFGCGEGGDGGGGGATVVVVVVVVLVVLVVVVGVGRCFARTTEGAGAEFATLLSTITELGT